MNDATDSSPRLRPLALTYAGWALALAVVHGVGMALLYANRALPFGALEVAPRMLWLNTVSVLGPSVSLLAVAFALVAWGHDLPTEIVVRHRLPAVAIVVAMGLLGTFVVVPVTVLSGFFALRAVHGISADDLDAVRSMLSLGDVGNVLARVLIAGALVGIGA